MVVITNETLTPEGMLGKIPFPEGTGSVVLHFAVVKPVAEGKATSGIRFKPTGDVDGEMRSLEAMLRDKWNVKDMVLARRLGDLKINDIISIVVAAAPGRDSAFGACQEAIEGFKKMKSLSKEELFE